MKYTNITAKEMFKIHQHAQIVQVKTKIALKGKQRADNIAGCFTPGYIVRSLSDGPLVQMFHSLSLSLCNWTYVPTLKFGGLIWTTGYVWC